MSDQEPISALPLDSTPPVSGDVLPIVHAGVTYQINTDTLGISSLTPKYVLFANASGNISQDSNLQYDPSSHKLTVTVGALFGTGSSSNSALITINSTTQGFLPPAMTTTQKNAITNTAGLVVFDTTLNKLCVNSGAGWQTITST